jgi:pyruvate dehydrogenase E1 component
MLHEQRDEFHYITVMNENVAQPPMPAGVTPDEITSGLYRLPAQAPAAPQVRLVGSGMILHEVIAAAALLRERFGVAAEVWSATSFSELARDARAAQRHARLHPAAPARPSRVDECLAGDLPVVAATDYVRAVPQMIAEYVGAPSFTTLGTDGFGRSATRRDLRRFFEVDRGHVALAALDALARLGRLERARVADAIAALGLDAEVAAPWLA